MTPEACRRAAGLLLAARRDRRPISGLPEACRPRILAEAYAVQAAVLEALGGEAVGGGEIAGFKIGATSRAAQDFLAVREPFYGGIPKGRVVSSPATLGASGFNFCLIEPEFAFRLSADLAPRGQDYRRADVAVAVASVHPAFEVVTSAYGEAWTKVGAPALVADNGVHGCLVLGLASQDWRGLDLAEHGVVFRRNGREAGRGRGANALGHPLDALAWLANRAVLGGRGLKAGDIVTTGVVTPFLYAEAGDDLAADFGSLGEVRLSMTD